MGVAGQPYTALQPSVTAFVRALRANPQPPSDFPIRFSDHAKEYCSDSIGAVSQHRSPVNHRREAQFAYGEPGIGFAPTAPEADSSATCASDMPKRSFKTAAVSTPSSGPGPRTRTSYDDDDDDDYNQVAVQSCSCSHSHMQDDHMCRTTMGTCTSGWPRVLTQTVGMLHDSLHHGC